MGHHDGMKAMAGSRDMLDQEKSMTPEFRLLLACARVVPSQQDEAAIRAMLFEGIDWTRFARTATVHGPAALAGRTLNFVAPDMMPDKIRDVFRVNEDPYAILNLRREAAACGVA
jgi:hypothetical protein